MRIDEIDLIGNFKISGSTGSSGKVLGITQGNIGWITPPSGGGGGVGAQGATGPGIFCIGTSGIVIGCGSGVVGYSNDFSIIGGKSFIHGAGNTHCIFLENGILSSRYSCLYSIGSYNTILSSLYSCILGNNNNTSIISSGRYVYVTNSDNSIVLSSCGQDGTMTMRQSDNSFIVSSHMRTIYMDRAYSSGIISSYCSIVSSNPGLTSSNSVVISSECGEISRGFESVIVSSCRACIYRSYQSVILSSFLSQICLSENSVIIAGAGNCICNSCNSVILGGTGLTLSSTNATTLAQKSYFQRKINFKSVASAPSPLTNGLIWYSNNQLYTRSAGLTLTFSLVT